MPKIKRLANSLFAALSSDTSGTAIFFVHGVGDEFGRGLSKRKGSFLMSSFRLHKPFIMLLTEWNSESDDIFKPGPPNSDVAIKKDFILTLKKPCPFVEHWDVARRLLASGPDTETSWAVQKLVLSQRPGLSGLCWCIELCLARRLPWTRWQSGKQPMQSLTPSTQPSEMSHTLRGRHASDIKKKQTVWCWWW